MDVIMQRMDAITKLPEKIESVIFRSLQRKMTCG
jgi:hypothetical protein